MIAFSISQKQTHEGSTITSPQSVVNFSFELYFLSSRSLQCRRICIENSMIWSELRRFWNITSGIYAKYHVQIMLLFVYTTTRKRFVIFTSRYFKLSWNTTALSQSNFRNFSCSSIMGGTCLCSYCCSRYLWFYHWVRLGIVKLVTTMETLKSDCHLR